MGLKTFAKKIAKTAAWPFVALAKAVFSPRGRALLSLAAQAALKTPLGLLVQAVVEEIANIRNLETGAEKHAAAFEKIVAEAKARKLDWKESLVRLLIELAVQRLKGNI